MHDPNNHFSPTWTKYICTIGPSSATPEIMEELIKSGATMLRNNFAHAQYDEYRLRKATLDELNKKLGTNVHMQADLQGRNIRLGTFDNEKGGLEIIAGEEYIFYTVAGKPEGDNEIQINDETLHLDVKAGEPISFADGAIEGEILEVMGHRLRVRMINGGFMKSRKSINVPDTKLTGSSITDKDKRDLEFLMEAGVDWVALSFISTAAEIREVREMIGDRPIRLISKIERREAIKNLTEIIEESDAVMIARGDLGIELPMEEIPILQKIIIDLCEYNEKPVITATQMLLSMAKSLRPTRAEVSDVANAVFARSDALMLSEETADGVNPGNALRTMVKITSRIEDYLYNRKNYFSRDEVK